MSNVILRPRRGTASQWASANPVLAEGEIGIEVPSGGVGTGIVKMKFGDGITAWNDLPYGVEDVTVVQNLDVESTTKVPSVSAVKSAIDELGESVAEGKALIASAITDKGVTTDSEATFETMASNIGNIETNALPESVTYSGSMQCYGQNGYGSVTARTNSSRSYPTLGYKKATITTSGSVTNASIVIKGDSSGNFSVNGATLSNQEFDISNDSIINVDTSGNSVQNGSPAYGNVYVQFTYLIVLHN